MQLLPKKVGSTDSGAAKKQTADAFPGLQKAFLRQRCHTLQCNRVLQSWEQNTIKTSINNLIMKLQDA